MISSPKITIIDYGVGNLQSLKRAFDHFGFVANISEEADIINSSDGVVLPGVGAFEAGMRGLKLRGLVGHVREFAFSGKPMLGICLGAQLMLSEGQEFGVFEGLGLIPGKVVEFGALENNEKIPHIGWNRVYRAKKGWQGTILDSIMENSNTYFVHSYVLEPENTDFILALSNYGGQEFCSVIKKDNIYGCQFHPEKSGNVGLEIIKNFINIVKGQ